MKNDYSFTLIVAVILAGVLTACITASSPSPATSATHPVAAVSASGDN